MARTCTYLNFQRNTEDAFRFYRSVFGGEFGSGGISRFRDIPLLEGGEPIDEKDKNLVLHVELELPGGHLLMGTDAPESMGFKVFFGNNFFISIEMDTRADTRRLFEKMSKGGKITMKLQEMIWGAYMGTCTDKYGVQWMFNYTKK